MSSNPYGPHLNRRWTKTPTWRSKRMEKLKMIKTRREPVKAFIASLLAFSLTACSTGQSKNEWRDLGPHQVPETKVSPSSQRWGTDMDLTARDPQIAPGYLIALRCPD